MTGKTTTTDYCTTEVMGRCRDALKRRDYAESRLVEKLIELKAEVARREEAERELKECCIPTSMERCKTHGRYFRPSEGCPWCEIDRLKAIVDGIKNPLMTQRHP